MQVLVATDLVSEALQVPFVSLAIDVCGWLRLFFSS
jgi:superfamily II DNA/RNA helicase